MLEKIGFGNTHVGKAEAVCFGFEEVGGFLDGHAGGDERRDAETQRFGGAEARRFGDAEVWRRGGSGAQSSSKREPGGVDLFLPRCLYALSVISLPRGVRAR